MIHVLLNSTAGGGRARARWRKVEAALATDSTPRTVHEFGPETVPRFDLQPADAVWVAGGDGTFHQAIGYLIARHGLARLREIELGFVGVGSNNCLLLPSCEHEQIAGFSARARGPAVDHDLGEVRFASLERPGTYETRYFLANASLGLLAEANHRFNRDPVVRALKRSGGLFAEETAFLRAWASFTPPTIEVRIGETVISRPWVNFHVIKHAWYTADFAMPNAPAEGDGRFQLFGLGAVSKMAILKRFAQMSAGQQDRAFDWTHSAADFTLRSDSPLKMELDGEIVVSRRFEVRCHARVLRLRT